MPDGFALPPPTTPSILTGGPSIPRGPDLEKDYVKQYVGYGLQNANNNLGSYASAATTQTSGTPTFKPFSASSVDGLTPLQSKLDKAVSGDIPPEDALARFLGTAITHPFSSGVDEYQTGKIKQLQEKFYADHDYDLKQLSKDLGDAKTAMRNLASWLAKQHIPDNGIRDLMLQKAKTGNQAMSDLDDALASATDPDDRAKLQAMKNDFDSWMKDRDARLKPEWQEETDLENRIDHLNREIYYGQSDGLMKAGMSNGPTTDTGGGKVVGSTHQQPQSLAHVQSLRDFLLGERLKIVKTMGGVY